MTYDDLRALHKQYERSLWYHVSSASGWWVTTGFYLPNNLENTARRLKQMRPTWQVMLYFDIELRWSFPLADLTIEEFQEILDSILVESALGD